MLASSINELSNGHGKMPRMTKPVYRENVYARVWVDVEPLKAGNLYQYEDSDGYTAAVKASKRKGVSLFRVIARLAVGTTTDEILTAIATNKAKAIATAKQWAAQERALLN
jgi:hypothetical protein